MGKPGRIVGPRVLSARLWPLPACGVVLAVVAGIALPHLDARLKHRLPSWLSSNLFEGGAGAARAVLETIAGSLVSVTALTFSLTVVTLQLASSQFSPRLLRTFTRDRFVQATLALFLGTFTYALTVLRAVRTVEGGGGPVVPQLSVSVAFVLALASVLALVLFLAHLTREIRVETMLRNVHAAAGRTARRLLPEREESDTEERDGRLLPPAHALPVLAADSGFLTWVDDEALVAAAVDADALLRIDVSPGSSLIEGTPVGAIWPRASGALPDDRDGLLRRVTAALTTGPERTEAQDVAFGLRQLTDVAVRALSPGVNDPTTAVHALSHASALLCDLAGRDLGPRLLRDDRQRVRVDVDGPDLAELLDLVVSQPRRYGASEPEVLARLTGLLRELAWCAPPDRHAPLRGQLARLRATVAAQDFDDAERGHLAHLADEVDQALAGRWTGRGSSSS
ncbi:DUF2254 domain-containing protein [Streptomyces sp. NPDC048566]|uniref:DUF2254 domain-containing protein n=1 Tax=Streptomyces sp. NPDC048566 TaxID=3365569 RepID=UPI0037165E93